MKRGRSEVVLGEPLFKNKRIHRKEPVVVSVLQEGENVVHHCGKKWYSEEYVASLIEKMQRDHANEMKEKEKQHAEHVEEVFLAVRAQIADNDRRVAREYEFSYLN